MADRRRVDRRGIVEVELEPHALALGVELDATCTRHGLDQKEPAATDLIGIEVALGEQGLAAVADLDPEGAVVAVGPNVDLGAAVDDGVRGELAGEQRDDVDEVVKAP